MRIGSVLRAVVGVLLLASFLTLPALAQFTPDATTADAATARLIVKLRPAGIADASGETSRRQVLARPDRVLSLAQRSGLALRTSRDLGGEMLALTLAAPLSGDSLEQTLAALRANPDVEFAEIDHRRYARAVPSDPLYGSQWYLQSVETAATNFEAAWDTTTGAANTVIAVLDTGVRFDHPDLASRLLPGYDFVSGESTSSFASANDGDGWDADASDPGDWVNLAESQSGPLARCDVSRSSWHGTRVAAMIGAATDNGAGIASGTWSGSVLPVRVLGKCGGFDSDIITAMRWAAGFPVAGVPTNPNPARILNLSLGGADSCGSAYGTVITELTAAGVLVVVSAGNDSGPVEAPANCAGVLAVGGLRHVGTKVGYSSLGAEVGISAPAGNCPNVDTTFLCDFSLITADNDGQTGPGNSTYTDKANYNIGTSFSAPIVSAVAGLMRGVNAGLTTVEFIARIKSGSRRFPAAEPGLPTCPSLDSSTGQCNCTTTTCGAGIADAPGAVAEALRPMARVVAPSGSGAGQNVLLNGSGSAAARSRTITSYAWTVVSGMATFVGATNSPNATVAVPASGHVTVQLAVTDDTGRSDAQKVTLGSSGGGGGGAVHPLMLLTLGLLALARRRSAPHR